MRSDSSATADGAERLAIPKDRAATACTARFKPREKIQGTGVHGRRYRDLGQFARFGPDPRHSRPHPTVIPRKS